MPASVLAADALTTLDNFKAALNISTSDTSEDPYLERLINRASRWVEAETERKTPDGKYGLKARRYNGATAAAPSNLHPTTKVPDEDYVYFSGYTKDKGGDTVIDEKGYGLFYLPAWPVQANSVLTFQLAALSDRDSGLVGGESWDTDDLVELDDYVVEREKGTLRSLNGRFSPGFRNYRVQMAAGYQTAADPYVPDELEQLCIELCRMLYRDTKNVKSESMAGLSRTFGEAMEDPLVRQVIARYKRSFAVMFPPSLLRLVKLYHVPTTGTPQSYPSTPDVTTTGAFYPMDQKAHVLEGGDYQDPHELLVKRNIDVRVGDKVVVSVETNGALSEANFYVKKVTAHRYGAMPMKRANLSTQA